MTVGENIKRIRKEKGITQKKLGELCGIAEPNIRKYELGKANPKIETLMKIAQALEVPINELKEDMIMTMEQLDTALIDSFYKMYCHELEIRNICIKKIVSISEQLNSDGMVELMKYADSLTKDELLKSIYFNNEKLKSKFPNSKEEYGSSQ